jgi:hypothetical protein
MFPSLSHSFRGRGRAARFLILPCQEPRREGVGAWRNRRDARVRVAAGYLASGGNVILPARYSRAAKSAKLRGMGQQIAMLRLARPPDRPESRGWKTGGGGGPAPAAALLRRNYPDEPEVSGLPRLRPNGPEDPFDLRVERILIGPNEKPFSNSIPRPLARFGARGNLTKEAAPQALRLPRKLRRQTVNGTAGLRAEARASQRPRLWRRRARRERYR